MADNAITLEQLSEKLMTLTDKVSTLSTENQTLKVQLAEAGVVTKQFAALKEKVKDGEITAHRTMIKNMLEAAVKNEDILPSARERFLKIYKVDEDDGVVVNISKEDVAEYIKDNPNTQIKKKRIKQFSALKASTDDLPDGIAPDAGMVMLVNAVLREDGIKDPTDKDIERATIKAFRANPSAAEAYQTQQNDIELGRHAARN